MSKWNAVGFNCPGIGTGGGGVVQKAMRDLNAGGRYAQVTIIKSRLFGHENRTHLEVKGEGSSDRVLVRRLRSVEGVSMQSVVKKRREGGVVWSAQMATDGSSVGPRVRAVLLVDE